MKASPSPNHTAPRSRAPCFSCAPNRPQPPGKPRTWATAHRGISVTQECRFRAGSIISIDTSGPPHQLLHLLSPSMTSSQVCPPLIISGIPSFKFPTRSESSEGASCELSLPRSATEPWRFSPPFNLKIAVKVARVGGQPLRRETIRTTRPLVTLTSRRDSPCNHDCSAESSAKAWEMSGSGDGNSQGEIPDHWMLGGQG